MLTNTVEQSWIFVPLVLAPSPRLAPGQLKLLRIAVSVWCASRVMFWVGYHVAPHFSEAHRLLCPIVGPIPQWTPRLTC